jgi:hypothetical protein
MFDAALRLQFSHARNEMRPNPRGTDDNIESELACPEFIVMAPLATLRSAYRSKKLSRDANRKFS